MTIVRRHFHGLPYDSYSLAAVRRVKNPADVRLWAGLGRPSGSNYQRSNRINPNAGAFRHILGGVQHIGAGPQSVTGPDESAETLTGWGLNPTNFGASWHDANDRDSWVPYLPAWTRPWIHGVAGSPVDMNSIGAGQEMGVRTTNWDAHSPAFVTAHLRMSAAAWAIWFGTLNWPLKFTLNRAEVYRLAQRGESWGLTSHAVLTPETRTDPGVVYRNGRRVDTFPWGRLMGMIREELAIRTGTAPPVTPGLPPGPIPGVKPVQELLNAIFANLDVDGRPGPLTRADIEKYSADFGYTGQWDNWPALTTHLEATMSMLNTLNTKLDAILNAQAETDERVRQQLNTLGRQNVQIRDEGPQRTAAAVWAYRIPTVEGTVARRRLGATWRAGGAQLASLVAAADSDGRQAEVLEAVGDVGALLEQAVADLTPPPDKTDA